MSQEYIIKTPADLLLVPRDKWDALLADVRSWMEMREKAQPMVDAGILQLPNEIHWVDDGHEGLSSITITRAGTNEFICIDLRGSKGGTE